MMMKISDSTPADHQVYCAAHVVISDSTSADHQVYYTAHVVISDSTSADHQVYCTAHVVISDSTSADHQVYCTAHVVISDSTSADHQVYCSTHMHTAFRMHILQGRFYAGVACMRMQDPRAILSWEPQLWSALLNRMHWRWRGQVQLLQKAPRHTHAHRAKHAARCLMLASFV